MNNRKSTQVSSHHHKPPNRRQQVNSANKEKNLQSNHNWFKDKDQQLIILIKQYLQKNGYNKSFEIFKNQKPIRKLSLNKNYEEENKNTSILQAFDRGARDEFFRNTLKVFSSNDQDLRKLQFELNIYFCIYSIHPSIKKANSIDKSSMDSFRKYIETKGAELSKTNQFLSFYALPFITKPQQHSALSHIFTKDWIQKLRTKVTEVFQNVKPISASNKPITNLQQIFYNYSQAHRDETCKQNCKHLLEAQQVRNRNKQLINYIDIIQNHYNSFTQSSKENLLESNMKWFQFAKELFSLVKKAIKGQKIDKLDKYEGFLSKSVEELIYGTNDISLFQRNSNVTEEVSIIPNQNRKANNRKVQTSLVCQIDLDKINRYFKQDPNKIGEVQICLVLKALKDRFMKLKSPYARREIIISYSRHDICGIKLDNQIIQKNLLSPTLKIKQFYLRLLNFITTDFYGIAYLSTSQNLIEKIIEIFGNESEENVSRKYVLSILQRFSLLPKPQSMMISFGIIPIIFRIFKAQKEQLCEYSRQYLTAMIMNLSLRRQSRPHFQKCKIELITILLNNVTSDDPMTKDYVNGALYSIIQSSPLIRQEAIRQQAIPKIEHLIQSIPNNQHDQHNDQTILIRQYQYILDALKGQNQIQQQSIMSDEQQQEMQLDDIDEQQQDDVSEISEDPEQYIDGQDQYLSGEELLMKQFALLGPDAMRQQMLTRSILDQTSKKTQNMSASMNRSRRIDNIFNQRPTTSLLPDLNHSINPLKQ